LKLSIILHTAEYRGDHSADIAITLDSIEGETVEALWLRAAKFRDGRPYPSCGDCIEIREIVIQP
jgi:hypothetical protein